MIIPILVLAAMTGVAAWKVRGRKNAGLTPERQAIYESALATLKEPSKLRELADRFAGEGLSYEADILRKRAAIRELPKEKKLERKAIFKAAINSKNVEAVRNVASAFAGEGCFGAARDLNRHAESLLIDVISEPDGSDEVPVQEEVVEPEEETVESEEPTPEEVVPAQKMEPVQLEIDYGAPSTN